MSNATWIVVADGSRGRIFARSAGNDGLLSPLPYDFVGSRLHAGDRLTDRAGQTLERHGPGGHAKSKSVAVKEHDQEVLAKEVCEALRTGRNDHQFDRLVLIAPPAFLGRLRTALDDVSAKLVVATHAKDLSSLSQHELETRLHELVPG